MPVRLGGGGKRARIRKKVEKELSILKENKNLIIEKLILLGEEYQNYLGVCRVSKLQISINKFRKALFLTCNKRLLLSRRRAVGAKYINALFARLVKKKHDTPVFFTVHFLTYTRQNYKYQNCLRLPIYRNFGISVMLQVYEK